MDKLDLQVEDRKPKRGEKTFFLCACEPENPHPFIPIVTFNRPPIVVALHCPKCKQYLRLLNGAVQEPAANGG